MVWAKRIFLFMMTNILVVATISLIISLLGLNGRGWGGPAGMDYTTLAVYCAVWGFAGSFISLLISKQVAKWSMGVRVIDPRAQSTEAEQLLLNTVYDLARKAGIRRMPEVGIYQSPEVNAFATGPTRNRSLVAVSSGLLNRMDRSSIEGVLGHEVAHIANGDMVTMTLLQGIINSFVMFFARVLAFAIESGLRRGDDRGSPGLRIFLTFALELIFGFLGMMIVAAFSRYREFRADRGSAKLGGRGKMIAALQSLQRSSGLLEPGHESLAAFKISGKQGGIMALLSTHPPLEQRIARLQQEG